MAYYRDLRAFLDTLEQRGKLYRFTAPVDKDRELFPLYRIQLQGLPEAERKVFLFEDVRGARGNRYAMPVVAGVYGTESLQTNSFHHQALKDVATPFEVSGRSADGMIEAVEANEKGCFFAVQWHPEMMHAHDTLQLAPFTRLVEKSSSRRLAATGD